jgi:gliding motility-associated-like protein
MNPSTIYSDSGLYTVILSITTPQGCTGSDTIVNAIESYSTPVAEFSFAPLTPSILFNTVDFIDKSLGVANQWNWIFGDSLGLATTNAPSFTFNEVGLYDVTLIVSNQYQCSDTIVKTIFVVDDYSFFIPKAFTPNDDGVNDVLEMYGFNFGEFDIKIYNRIGQLVKESDKNPLWDGKDLNGNLLPEGIYIYTIKMREILNNKRHEFQGTITLIR